MKLLVRDGYGSEVVVDVTDSEVHATIERLASEWYGDNEVLEACEVYLYWECRDENGGVIEKGNITQQFEADESAVICDVMHGHKSCGNHPDDHDWVSGDTRFGAGSILIHPSHCHNCDLRKNTTTGGEEQFGHINSTHYYANEAE